VIIGGPGVARNAALASGLNVVRGRVTYADLATLAEVL
jgi:alanine dehydrogenase